MGGTDLLGALDLGRLEVDSDNGASTGVHGTLDGAGTNTTTTDNGDDVTGTYVAAINGRAEAGRDTTGDKGSGAQVVPRLDANQRSLVHDDVLGEGSELGHAVEVLAVERVAPGAVGDHRTGQGGGTKVTDVLTTRGTELTLTAGGNE